MDCILRLTKRLAKDRQNVDGIVERTQTLCQLHWTNVWRGIPIQSITTGRQLQEVTGDSSELIAETSVVKCSLVSTDLTRLDVF